MEGMHHNLQKHYANSVLLRGGVVGCCCLWLLCVFAVLMCLFVVNLQADEVQLENFFSTHGQVLECKIIMDKVTGKSKGYGFVTFKDATAAEFVKQTANFNFLGKNVCNASLQPHGGVACFFFVVLFELVGEYDV
jgi:RNA recognition motif. (a.k.a. RRM, RBD, or RNP domain)